MRDPTRSLRAGGNPAADVVLHAVCRPPRTNEHCVRMAVLRMMATWARAARGRRSRPQQAAQAQVGRPWRYLHAGAAADRGRAGWGAGGEGAVKSIMVEGEGEALRTRNKPRHLTEFQPASCFLTMLTSGPVRPPSPPTHHAHNRTRCHCCTAHHLAMPCHLAHADPALALGRPTPP